MVSREGSNTIEILKEYCRLIRLQSAGFASIIPVLGALCTGSFNPLHITILFLIGLFVYIWGSALNEYVDIELDKLSGHLSMKPLVRGTIPKRNALIIAFISAAATLILGGLFNTWAFLVLLISCTLATIYDLFGKKFRGAEATLACWACTLYLFGAVSVTVEPSPLIYIVTLLVFLRLLFETSVEGGLKDVEHDSRIKAKTLPNILGVKVVRNNIHTPYVFKAYAFSVELVFTAFIFIPFLFFDLNYTIAHILALLLLISGMFYTMKFLRSRKFQRKKIVKSAGVHELLAFIAIGVMLSPLIGIFTVFLLIVLPALWEVIFLLWLYGRLLPNI